MLRCFNVKADSTISCHCPTEAPAKHVMSMHAEDDRRGMSWTLPYFIELPGITVLRGNHRDSLRNYKNSAVT